MRRSLLLSCILLGLYFPVSAQMWDGQDTLYGNEWINFNQTYYKILVAQDGIYRIPGSVLSQIVPSNVEASKIRMYYFGKEIPIYTTTDGPLGSEDHIDFFGVQNRGEMDAYLYAGGEEPFNPNFSLFTDSSAYFITWGDSPGKRFQAIDNILIDLPAKEEFYWEKVVSFPSLAVAELIKNKISGIGNKQVELSRFQNAEGWCKKNLTDNTYSIPISSIFPGYSNDIAVSIRYAHLNADSQTANKSVTINGLSYPGNEFHFFEGKEFTYPVPPNALGGSLNINVTGVNNTCLSNVEFEYPRLFNASGSTSFTFYIASSPVKKYIEIENFAHGGVAPVLYDLTNELRIQTIFDNDIVKIALEPSLLDRKLILVHPETGIKPVEAFHGVNFVDYSQQDPEFLIVFNRAIAVDGTGTNQVAEYAAYRQNSFTTDTFEIQQLYDQFAYGINRHPMAIRNLVFFAKENWTNPQYLLLIGKGREYPVMRSANNVTANNNKTFFIPTFGYTGADNLLVSPIGTIDPIMAVGRLPVVNGDELRVYLDKVKEFEEAPSLGGQNIQDKAWMKRVLHLGGGREEQPIIQSHLEGMANTIENNRFGAKVTAFYNKSTDPVVTSTTGEIIGMINGGISILSFFGHSAATVLDFNFDDPDSYENQGKYPVMFSFGCLSGEMFTTSRGLGERFITADHKGMIAFISSPGYGFVSSLNVLGSNYYQKLGGNMYGQSIGNILKETLKILGNSNSDGDLMLGEQTSIQGDPSLKINPRPGPDYLIDPGSVKIDPPLLTTSLDSFTLSFDLWNIGQHIPDTILGLKIEHQLPNNAKYTLLTDTLAAPAFSVSLTYSLPLLPDDEDLKGLNRFLIAVDPDPIVEEPLAAEFNNEHIGPDGIPGHPVYFSSADAEPLYPPDFGIVGSGPVELNASTGYPFSPQLTYWMEIDTTEIFNSPFKKSVSITQSGGVIKWTPDIVYQPNTVYYWRISPDSSVTESFRWRSHSFVYLPGSSPGWNQSHFFQFQYGNFEDLKLEEPVRKLEFIDDVVDFKIRNNIRSLFPKNPRYFRNQEDLYIQFSSQDYLHYQGQFTDSLGGVFIAIIDPVQIKPQVIDPWPPGTDFSKNNKSFMFKTETPTHRKQLIDFLENEDLIPSGYYVLLFTCQDLPTSDYKPQNWESDTALFETNLFQVLEAQGADSVRNLASLGSLPYNLFYRKNHQNDFETKEKIGDKTSLNELNVPVEGSWTEGTLTSPPIGPAKKWETLKWEIEETNQNDRIVQMIVIGIRQDGTDSLLYDDIKEGSFPLGDIDASLFPRLKLRYFAKDPTDKTPPNLEYWRVHYQGIPEAALDAASHFTLESDTILQGAPMILEVATENLSDYDMDSLLVRYTILNAQNEASTVEHRYRPLPARDTLITRLQYDTRPSVGVHQLTIDVNPDEDQPEMTHINNVGVLQFYVERDLRNPLLDVTFDGMHILDGDLVSAQPLINVQLKDENPYLALEDTSLFRLLLVHPGELEERLYFTDGRIRFYPAELQNGKNNRARVEFNPILTQDGQYEFYVEAADATGNKTGNIDHKPSTNTFGYDYKISFKVITESMISNVLNYPNPFSTSTRFLYTLTGSEPPDYFSIQIYTVSGRVVREISQSEIGEMKIGTHLTDYAWDGRDEFGDPLANGVYLYRVAAKKANGENFKAYASGADNFFEKGFGKLVIIR